MSALGDPSAWEYDYPSPTGMGREVTLSPPWLFDPDGVRNGRPLFRALALTDEEREAVERQARLLERDAERSGMIGLQEMLMQDAATLRGLLARLG